MRTLFAFGSPSFRRLGRDPEGLTEAEMMDLVLAEPRLLRRPLLVTGDGRVLAGATAIAKL